MSFNNIQFCHFSSTFRLTYSRSLFLLCVTIQAGRHWHGVDGGHRITCLRSCHRISCCQFLNLCSLHDKGIHVIIYLCCFITVNLSNHSMFKHLYKDNLAFLVGKKKTVLCKLVFSIGFRSNLSLWPLAASRWSLKITSLLTVVAFLWLYQKYSEVPGVLVQYKEIFAALYYHAAGTLPAKRICALCCVLWASLLSVWNVDPFEYATKHSITQ